MILSRCIRDEWLAEAFFGAAVENDRLVTSQYLRETIRPFIGPIGTKELSRGPSRNNALLKTINELCDLAAESGKDNGYHNPPHTGHVTLMTGYFCQQANMDDHSRLIAVLCALGHDLHHPGKGNPSEDKAYNERHSAKAVAHIMRKYGAHKDDVDFVKAAIISTSPDGPHAFLKNNCQPVILGDDNKPYYGEPEQRMLMSNAPQTRLMRELALILCDADVYSSAGTNAKICSRFSQGLNVEEEKNNGKIDFDTLGFRMRFLINIVGEDGFSSQIARKLANGSFRQLLKETTDGLKPH